MSAYIVSEETMAKVVDAIATAEEREGRALFTASAEALARAVLAGDAEAALALADEVTEYAAASADPHAGLTRLGRELYRMNRAAVVARYGDRPDDDYQAVPKFIFAPELLAGETRGWAAGDDSPAITAVCELIYQCSEGDIPGRPLYRRLVESAARLREEWKAGAAGRARKAGNEWHARRLADLDRLPAEHPHLVTAAARPKWNGYRLAAENIRRELRRRFPGVKFRVTSDSFSMGNSVDVHWTDGPTTAEVEAVTSRHAGGSFNGMEDIYEYDRDNTFGELFGRAKYVHCSRDWTIEAVRRANADETIPENWAQGNDSSRVHWIRKAWSEMSFADAVGVTV
jgi:hypothetical protein